jgi:hypothetical protein
MTRRLLLAWVLLLVLTGCRWHGAEGPDSTFCIPPAGGRCAHDSAWSGPIYLTRDGLRLHQVIVCGGTLHASETADHVYLRLHLGAIGAGEMSCARADVGVRLASPLGDRTVLDSIGGHVIRVVRGRPPDHLIR